jgi:hypothetical protein
VGADRCAEMDEVERLGEVIVWGVMGLGCVFCVLFFSVVSVPTRIHHLIIMLQNSFSINCIVVLVTHKIGETDCLFCFC